MSANNGHLAATFQFDYTSGAWLQIDGNAGAWWTLPGLLYGDGFFDTMAVWGGAIQFWPFHQLKVLETALVLGIMVPDQALESLPACVNGQEGVLRVYVVAQEAGLPHLWVATFTEQVLERETKSVSVEFASGRLDAEALAHQYKLLSRFSYRQAQREAGGGEALLLNKAGRVASFTSGCVVYGMAAGVYCIPAAEGRQNSATLQILQARYGIMGRPLEANLPGVDWMLAVNSLRLRVVERVGQKHLARPDGAVLGTFLHHWPWQQILLGGGLPLNAI